ncbi:2-hydroxyacid dehydrogenase [Leucothrix sargassi]|nr:2-hydroxyacid dehydrogenase [Leucothrix sargassi]
MNRPEVLQLVPFSKAEEQRLNDAFTVHRLFEISDTEAFFQTKGQHIKALTTRAIQGVSREIMARLPSLEMIAVYGVGYDKVDLEAANARNIFVTNTPDVLTGDVADLAVGMLLMVSRRMYQAQDWVRTNKWINTGSFPLSTRVHGKRVGIVGLGRIGDAIAERLSGFDMAIAYTSREPKPSAAPDWAFVEDAVSLARQSDILIVALAATPDTHHFINREVLEALGEAGILINISRASNIDEEALLSALENKVIAGAGLDVFEGEPAINPRFLALDNVLLQPHIGSATHETREAMMSLVLQNLTQYFKDGTALTPV